MWCVLSVARRRRSYFPTRSRREGHGCDHRRRTRPTCRARHSQDRPVAPDPTTSQRRRSSEPTSLCGTPRMSRPLWRGTPSREKPKPHRVSPHRRGRPSNRAVPAPQNWISDGVGRQACLPRRIPASAWLCSHPEPPCAASPPAAESSDSNLAAAQQGARLDHGSIMPRQEPDFRQTNRMDWNPIITGLVGIAGILGTFWGSRSQSRAAAQEALLAHKRDLYGRLVAAGLEVEFGYANTTNPSSPDEVRAIR